MPGFYVEGVSRRGYGTGTVRLVQTSKGWEQRAVAGDRDFMDCFNFDYVSRESEGDLRAWLRCDMTGIRSFDFDPPSPPVERRKGEF